MRSRYIASKTESEKIAIRIAREEIKRQMETFCPACQQRMEAQTIAVMCKALNARYGFGAKRLKELIDCAEGLGVYIYENGAKYDNAVKWLKDEMGINLEG